MLLDGPLRDTETLGDRSIGLSLGHLAQYLGLARRQPIEVTLRPMRTRLHEFIDDQRIDDRTTFGDNSYSARQFTRSGHSFFEQIRAAGRTVLEKSQRVRRCGVLTQHDDTNVRAV